MLPRIFLFMFLWLPSGTSFSGELPSVSHYSLRIHLFPKEERLEALAMLTCVNTTSTAQTEIPFLLYRLLDVQSVRNEQGVPLQFTQRVTTLADEPTWQVNSAKIILAQPLPIGSSVNIIINYSGSIYGYPEVMAYTRDKISEAYSLIRPDVIAYPIIGRPAYQSFRQSYQSLFSYQARVTAPSGYTVACGGLLKESRIVGDSVTFVYESKAPTWRIDIAAAKFEILKDEPHKLFVYTLPEDRQGAASVMIAMKRAIDFYSRAFGEVKNYQGYTAIEIPEGWGSQAGNYYILQAGAAFKDTQKVGEVYHEVAHTWNAKAKPEVQRCRWFDEAFASYFEDLCVREFDGEQEFLTAIDRSREIFIQRVNRSRKNFDTPIADYWKEELGGNSYSKGEWSLYILQELVGEKKFQEIIRAFLSEYGAKLADFKDFQTVAEKVSHRQLKKYFDEWIYGTESSRLLTEKVPIAEIIKRYQ
ncbi:MAG: hypothetical protein HY276_08195 [Ignavibacteriales bacterium]|nr:hypothetical protein [Ignavibacteriales bacterium]